MNDNDPYEEDVEECEECGGEIDFTETGRYWKTADERFWHDKCHDQTKKLDRIEEIREDLLKEIVGEDCFDGLSDDFHNSLDQIQMNLDDAIQREWIRQDQDLVTDGGITDQIYTCKCGSTTWQVTPRTYIAPPESVNIGQLICVECGRVEEFVGPGSRTPRMKELHMESL